MFARILEIDDQQVYLEIEKQLRFKSRYVFGGTSPVVARYSRVDIDFARRDGACCVVIRTIPRPS